MLEIPQRREIHEGRGHQQAEEAEKGIAVLDYEGGIAKGIRNVESEGNLVGAAGEERQQSNAHEEDPQHPGTKPEADFKPRDAQEHYGFPGGARQKCGLFISDQCPVLREESSCPQRLSLSVKTYIRAPLPGY